MFSNVNDTTFARVPRCAITGFKCEFGDSGAVALAHIVPRWACKENPFMIYDFDNMIWLRADIHLLFDAQRFTFNEHGVVSSNFTDEEKKCLGWIDEKMFRIDARLLTVARRNYTSKRESMGLNDWATAALWKKLATHTGSSLNPASARAKMLHDDKEAKQHLDM